MAARMRLRGEVCISLASILSFASLILLIFVHVGQINTSTVPRHIYMARVNMTGYGAYLSSIITPDPVVGLYTNNSNTPLNDQQGLRQTYDFGLYSYCAYVDPKAGLCGNQTAGHQFKPYDTVVSDMINTYALISGSAVIPVDLTFKDSAYLGRTSKAGYWLILLGSICAALAFITGIAKNGVTFFLSSIFSILGSFFLLVGAALWTVLIKKAESINTTTIASGQNIGIIVSEGKGLFLTWAAFACLLVSVIPNVLSCCTYRG